MSAFYWSWGISAAALIVLAASLGALVLPAGAPLGILIDRRGRYSLTHLQLVAWTIVVLSLISGIFWGRLVNGVDDPLGFSIPAEVLGALGITTGSALATTVVKASKDAHSESRRRIAASGIPDRPRLAQIFLAEEGKLADRVVDLAKFQNFVITIVLVVAYVALGIETIHDAGEPAALTGLPGFAGTFLTLMGISHGAYVAGKLPEQTGIPRGLTMSNPSALPTGVEARNP